MVRFPLEIFYREVGRESVRVCVCVWVDVFGGWKMETEIAFFFRKICKRRQKYGWRPLWFVSVLFEILKRIVVTEA